MTNPDFHPGCPNPTCCCQIPGPVCDEFMGLDGWRFCPRCGWAEGRHGVTPAVTPSVTTNKENR